VLNHLEVFSTRPISASVPAASAVDEGRIDDAEHAVRLAIGGRDFQRLFARGDRFVEAALAHVQTGQLGHDIGRARVELSRAFERRDRPVDVVRRLEVTAHEELGVGLATPIRRRALRSGVSRRREGETTAASTENFIGELFHKRDKVSYIAAWPSILNSSKFWRVPTVKRRSLL
jgi:hypothetical protein